MCGDVDKGQWIGGIRLSVLEVHLGLLSSALLGHLGVCQHLDQLVLQARHPGARLILGTDSARYGTVDPGGHNRFGSLLFDCTGRIVKTNKHVQINAYCVRSRILRRARRLQAGWSPGARIRCQIALSQLDATKLWRGSCDTAREFFFMRVTASPKRLVEFQAM